MPETYKPRVFKKVLERHNDTWLLCCWDDCEKQGFEAHKLTTPDGIHQITGYQKYISYVFCSERHREYFRSGHRGRYGSAA